jgi:hypothetical protein
MFLDRSARRAGLAVLVLATLAVMPARAQQQPSPAAIAAAQEIIALKGSGTMYDAVVPGVIEQAKNVLLQTNPNLGKDLNEVAAQLRKEYDGKRDELHKEVARIYASHFTEQELQDIATFYRSPLGKKMVAEEPLALEQSMRSAQDWANKFSDQMLARIRAEMKKRGHNL